MRQGRSFRQRMPTGARTPTQRAIAILRRFGPDAHVYLPGVGMLNGLQAGNYLDSSGTTQGTVDQPVGLVLDATGGLGVELATNAGIAYNASLSSGLIPSTATSNSTLSYGFFRNSFLTPGKRYQVSAAWSGNTLNRKLTFDDGQGPTNTQLQSTAQSGEITSQFTATAATFFAYASGIASVGESFTVSAISVREVTGIHASQPTTSAKPILRRGAVNLLTYSGDFSNAAWNKSNVTPVTGVADPLGGTGATKIVEGATTGLHYLGGAPYTATVGQPYTVVFVVQANERSWARIETGGSGLTQQSVHLNLSTGAFGASSGTLDSKSIAAIGGGWYIVALVKTAVLSATAGGFIYPAIADNTASYLGDGVSGINVYRAALFAGTYTAAQIQALGGIPLTTTAPASTALGNTYWQFDGSNDSLQLGGPLFQMADDHCVIAGGMYSGNNSNNNVVASPSQGVVITNRAGQVSYDNNNDSLQSSWYDGVNYDKLEFSYPKETGFVATAAKRGSLVIQRVGGVQRGIKSITVAFVSDRGSIGAYSGGQNQFTGNIYPVIAIKGTVTDADLLLLEKLVASMSGVTI